MVNDKRELCATLLGSEEGESLAIYDGKQNTPRLMLSVEENGNSVFFIRDSDGELEFSLLKSRYLLSKGWGKSYLSLAPMTVQLCNIWNWYEYLFVCTSGKVNLV